MLPKFETLVREIKSRRKELGWSQRKLARKAGVSKSLVGKLENKKNIPNYKSIKKIYKALYREDTRKKAREYISPNIKSIKPTDTVEDAAKMMKENDFSQLPVKDKREYRGLLLSTDLMGVEDREQRVRDITTHPLPVIPSNTPKDNFVAMFNSHKALLVEGDNEVIGIITPADLI